MLQQVIALIENNRLQDAKNLCLQLSRNNKKNIDLWLLMADINNRLGAIKDAKLNYKKAIKLKPDYTQAHTSLAMLYHGQELFSKAAQSYRRSLKSNNNQPTVHYNLGVVLQELNKHDEAEAEYRQAIELKPDYVKAHANLGFILRTHSKLDESIEHYQLALQLEPDIPELHYNLGLTFLKLGDTANAKKHEMQALSINPEYADAWCGLAAVDWFDGDFTQACENSQKSLALNPNNADALFAYSNALSGLGKYEEALEKIELALKKEPENLAFQIHQASTYASLGEHNKTLECCSRILKESPDDESTATIAAGIHEVLDDPQRALTYIQPFIKDEAPNVSVALCFYAISEKTGQREEAIKYLENSLQQKNISTIDRSNVHFKLGKAFDKTGEYDKAFKHYSAGNKLEKTDFDHSRMHQQVNREIKVFSKNFRNELPVSSEQSSRPIFIVGMPRSGTSLVEQIIASHSTVFGAGELTNISLLSAGLPAILNSDMQPPECYRIADKNIMTQLSQTYLNYLTELNDDARHVTDKLPGNYANLGLIQLLFPNSKIIYCKRNPLDNCLSCYFQKFSRNIPWSYDLTNLGLVYNEHLRLMEHWKNVLELPILEVQYETLTTNQEETTRDILNFLELEWEDGCMDFHKNKRLIWTASYNQVRQAMYSKSVERWKHYTDHIEPLIKTISNNT